MFRIGCNLIVLVGLFLLIFFIVIGGGSDGVVGEMWFLEDLGLSFCFGLE